MQVEGKLIKKLPFEQQKKKGGELIVKKNGEPFMKGGFVMLQKGDYPKEIFLEVFKEELAGMLANTDLETELIADVNVESREWEGRYFTSASCWRVNKTANVEAEKACANVEETDDLPF
jgi:hypothetical protein